MHKRDKLKLLTFLHFDEEVTFTPHFQQRLHERYQIEPSLNVLQEINLRRHNGDCDLLQWRYDFDNEEQTRQLLVMTIPGVEKDAVVIYAPENHVYVSVLSGEDWLKQELKRRRAPWKASRRMIKEFKEEGL
ncbi:hypothetical protein [Cerasicoccus frondis]|uniref:hypothetical protein n=1 Tax=Cerasicoccus frondis TaxID=490090 RepID=UPI0028527F51|nr:hypothetical protein [Cerasicoccus frondis]